MPRRQSISTGSKLSGRKSSRLSETLPVRYRRQRSPKRCTSAMSLPASRRSSQRSRPKIRLPAQPYP